MKKKKIPCLNTVYFHYMFPKVEYMASVWIENTVQN